MCWEILIVSKCLADFTGSFWKIERVIKDHKQSTKLYYQGRCEISDGSYAETGELTLSNGQKSLTSRTYIWNWAKQGIDSYFDNGLFFHRIDLTCLKPSARHYCGQDRYNVEYNFSDWPLWDATWWVNGPRKDYEMHSQYSKI